MPDLKLCAVLLHQTFFFCYSNKATTKNVLHTQIDLANKNVLFLTDLELPTKNSTYYALVNQLQNLNCHWGLTRVWFQASVLEFKPNLQQKILKCFCCYLYFRCILCRGSTFLISSEILSKMIFSRLFIRIICCA